MLDEPNLIREVAEHLAVAFLVTPDLHLNPSCHVQRNHRIK